MRGSRYGEVVAAAFVLGGATGFLIGLLTAPASAEPSRGEVPAGLRDRGLPAPLRGLPPAGRRAAGVERRLEVARPNLSLAVSG